MHRTRTVGVSSPRGTQMPEYFTVTIKIQVPLSLNKMWDTIKIAILIFLKLKQLAIFLRA